MCYGMFGVVGYCVGQLPLGSIGTMEYKGIEYAPGVQSI
jgi:hypothetical protein